MKKYLLSVMTLCLGMAMPAQAATSDVSSLQNTVYIESVSMPAGLPFNLVVNLKNAEGICGFGFDMVLPEGFDFAKNAEGAYFSMSLKRIDAKSLQTADGDITTTRTLKVVVNNAKNTTFDGNDGEVCIIPIKPSKDLAPGKYEITLKNISLTNPDAKAIYPGDDKTTVLTTDITVTPYEADVLLDETSVTKPEAAEGVDVKVLRTLVGGNWNTICLPFDMTNAQLKSAFGDDVKLAEFAGYDYDGDNDNIYVSFTAVDALSANKPYIIKVSSDITDFIVKNVNISAKNVKFKVGDGTMKGTYVANTEIEEDMLFLYDNKFYYSTGATKMKAFRAYFDFDDVLDNKALAATRILFDVNENTTGINGIAKSSVTGRIYSMTGQFMGNKMEKLAKGVYIIDGKKVIKNK